jgi:hypothetical protein
MIFMEKIIIENRTDMHISQAIALVLEVIKLGKISKTAKGKQYCFATRFTNDLIVVADKNKKSDRFVVYKDQL